MSRSQVPTLDVNLHPKQSLAFQSPATEIFYGGAAGGGKSHFLRMAAIIFAFAIPGLQVYLFRRIREDLIKNHMEGPAGFRATLAPFVESGHVEIVGDEVRFYNGSKIYLCHCKDEKHRFKYQGAEIHLLLIDELTHFTETIYRFLRNRVRMVGLSVPEAYRAKFPRIIASGNPGNIGHAFVKQTFIDSAAPLKTWKTPDSEGGMLRQFIPALLEDNPSMTEHDPDYEARLKGLGSDALVRAMRYGDWNVVEGAFFDCWMPHLHVVKPFEIPKHWPRFASGDWGSAKPFSFGWWAVCQDDTQRPEGLIPRGAIVRYREWYGCVKGKANAGLKMTAEEVGNGLKARNIKECQTGVLDPAAFAEDGGPSLASRIAKASGFHFRRADNARVPHRGAMGGWDMMRERFKGVDGVPMIFTFDTCRDSIRTIPVLQHDELRPEDLDTDMEDHAADEWRYACMSRPWMRPKPAKLKPRDGYMSAPEPEGDWMTA